jgi:DNA-binding IclR family transcriptional regulator
MKLSIDSSVPALDSGLDVLELIEKFPEGLSFSDILNNVNTSKSTLLRILKVLQRRDYLTHSENGLYKAGMRMEMRVGATPFDLLRHFSKPILETLADDNPGITVVLVGFTGREMVILEKIQREGCIHMLDPGTVRSDFSHAPWAWIFYSHMNEGQKNAVRENIEFPDFDRLYPEWKRQYDETGYCIDRECILPHIRRIAVPVFDGSGNVVAAVGIGANKLSMPDKHIPQVARQMLNASKKLEKIIG